MRKALAAAAVLALVVLIACADRGQVADTLASDDWNKYHGRRFEVVRVVDGDTLDVRVPDGDKPTTRIRLWAVNTPETAKHNRPSRPWADEATRYTRERTLGKHVTLELQKHQLRGRYGRLLAYVVLPDGSTLNAELIEQGYSKHDDRWNHDRLQAYDAIEEKARKAKRRLWSESRQTRRKPVR